jgi:hypothetical protein
MSGGAITADFIFSIEKRMRNFNERGYARFTASENNWASKLLRDTNIDGKSERVTFLLSTASIEQTTPNDGGESTGPINFDELATVTTEYFPAFHRRGYKINKLKYLNMLKGGIDPLAKWAEDIGTYGAYYPQRLLVQRMLYGETSIGYDGVAFFSASHPNHPLIPALGTYANLFTGAASGSYPGALPIDDTISADLALTNLTKALAYIMGVPAQPNGAGDPRLLEPAFILHPPRMLGRVAQLTDANFLAQAASGGAGSADVSPILKKWRLTEPILAKELDGSRSYTFPSPLTGLNVTVTGDDKTYYIVAREASETQLGAYLFHRRLPFTLHTYSGESGSEGVDAILGRSQELEYHYDGAMAVNEGHPYTIFKFKGA